MIDRLALYDTIYALASADGREGTLFGDCASGAREAFSRSLVGEEQPIVWFELPLAGRPRFDLHVAMSREALRRGVSIPSGSCGGYDRLFRWYAEEEDGGGGLAFAYDVSEGRIDAPAIHVNVNNAPLSDMGRFFDIAAGEGSSGIYDGFLGRLPQGWRVWYAGVHPGRPGTPLRVDCFVDRAVQDAYAKDLGLLERDLRAVGFEAMGQALPTLVAPILESPFGLELQFDLLRDGGTGPTLGLSAAFPLRAASGVRQLFAEGGAVAELMGKVGQLGLADGRWRQVADASFSMLVMVEERPVVLFCAPTFVKLRMRDGIPLDAKAYLQAGMWQSG